MNPRTNKTRNPEALSAGPAGCAEGSGEYRMDFHQVHFNHSRDPSPPSLFPTRGGSGLRCILVLGCKHMTCFLLWEDAAALKPAGNACSAPGKRPRTGCNPTPWQRTVSDRAKRFRSMIATTLHTTTPAHPASRRLVSLRFGLLMAGILPALLTLVACDRDDAGPGGVNYTYTFDADAEGWQGVSPTIRPGRNRFSSWKAAGPPCRPPSTATPVRSGSRAITTATISSCTSGGASTGSNPAGSTH
jgi:hypothetical protein